MRLLGPAPDGFERPGIEGLNLLWVSVSPRGQRHRKTNYLLSSKAWIDLEQAYETSDQQSRPHGEHQRKSKLHGYESSK